MSRSTESTLLISIIIAVRNGAVTLERAIRSIISQKYPSIELIVIDGGSDDGTVELIRKYAYAVNYWESEPDRGIYHAWNKALAHVHGEWVFFLGADDYLWDDMVLNQVAGHLSVSPDSVQVVYGKVSVLSPSGELLGEYGKPWGAVREHFLQEMVIPHQGVFHRASLFSTHGKFDESYKISGDYEMLLRVLPHNAPLFVPIMIAGMLAGGISSLSCNAVLTLKEAGRASEIHGFAGFRFRWRWNLTKAYTRKFLGYVLGQHLAGQITRMYRAISARGGK